MWVKTRILLILFVRAIPILGQDSETAPSPAPGNGSFSDPGTKIERTRAPEMTRPAEPFGRPSGFYTDQFYPVVPRRRPYPSSRSDSVPYFREYPSFGYPVAHSIEYPVGHSSKHLVVASFIGLLLLFAIIQNTIAAVKRRDALIDALSSREKRDVFAANSFNSTTQEQAEILNDDARIRCIQRTVCQENGRLSRNFPGVGRILAEYLTRVVERSLDPSTGWDRLVRDAAEAGIRGEDCSVFYRDCDVSTPLSRALGIKTVT